VGVPICTRIFVSARAAVPVTRTIATAAATPIVVIRRVMARSPLPAAASSPPAPTAFTED